jgi:hypothetical protein
MAEPGASPGLTRFFDRLVRKSLSDLRIMSDPVADYLARLLARFARTEALYAVRSATGERLESVVEMLLEAERTWAFDGPGFAPFREPEIRRHIGDYTLFMIGIFREHVERRASASFYVQEGKRAYRVVAEFERSALRPDARLFAALSTEFEGYAGALGYMKRVYLPSTQSPPGLRPVLRLLTEW